MIKEFHVIVAKSTVDKDAALADTQLSNIFAARAQRGGFEFEDGVKIKRENRGGVIHLRYQRKVKQPTNER